MRQRYLNREKIPLIIIILVAIILRLLYLHIAPQVPIVYDAARFYSVGQSLFNDKLGGQDWETLAVWGPGYPVFLALNFALFPSNVWSVRYLQAILSTLLCVSIYSVSTQLTDRRVALIAGLFTAVYPPLIFFTGRILTETLALFLLWSGLASLIYAIGLHSKIWMVVSGVVFGLACLTRPTLLPVVPFLVVALVLSLSQVNRLQRIVLSTWFISPVFVLFLGWYFLIASRATPIVGAAGVEFVISTAWQASNPLFRGWGPDIWPGEYPWFKDILKSAPLYPIAAIGNLIFQHIWYADNTWREVMVISTTELNIVQRILMIFALGGIGFGLTRARSLAPLFALLIGFGVLSIKFIEIRHNIPFMPAIFILAGMFVVNLHECIKHHPGSNRTKLLLIIGFLLLVTCLVVTSSFDIANIISSDPSLSGPFIDSTVIMIAMLEAITVCILVWGRLGPRSSLVVSFVPGVLFSILWYSYVYIGSEPRWHVRKIDFETLPGSAAQEIYLPTPITINQVNTISWLVDLESEANPPPLQISVNDIIVSPNQFKWQPTFCSSNTKNLSDKFMMLDEVDLIQSYWTQRMRPVSYITQRVNEWCGVYQKYAQFNGQSLSAWPQWWELAIDPLLVVNKKTVSLGLSWDNTKSNSGANQRVRLSETFPLYQGHNSYGPSTKAIIPSPKTSALRWLVTDDWRMWDSEILESNFTRSIIMMNSSDANQLSRISSRDGAWVIDQRGNFNIRLLILLKDGRMLIY